MVLESDSIYCVNAGRATFLEVIPDQPTPEAIPSKSAPLKQPEMAALTGAEVRELTSGVRRGDEAAFTRFHELYGLRLYKRLLALAHGSETDAREVLQMVMIKLVKRFEVFDVENRLWAWLCTVTRNSYLDYYRGQKREPRFVKLEALAPDLAEGSQTDDRLAAALRASLEELPAEDGELLRAFYLDRRSLSELAVEAGQSYKAIESRMTRLRRRVKEKLLTHLQNESTPEP